ncbi:SymE family type I addiction module toxin [Snodgrassella sp. B3837]|uniref:SymE family type I addiction module toxin n=1 Tax=unclassified Snodgrassella TaxID=2625236 RepID=UPI003A7F4A7A
MLAKFNNRQNTAPQPNKRFYTVGYVPQGIKPNSRPQLTIKGRWLEQIGFYTRRPVVIKVEHNKLIIEFVFLFQTTSEIPPLIRWGSLSL